ncbi:MAG TPA: hypothetical protein VGO60_09400 [Iamia sp.]|nr:hypothetical protein [Iamia sp.]
MGGAGALAVGGCTVATRSYLADARLAARSFVDHHPGARFTILVVDGDHMPPAAWTHRDVELVTPADLGLPADELLAMAAIYSPFEIACALKPLALRRTLEQADVGVYVDGDVEVLDPMDELVAAAAEHDVVLVPHVLDPVPRDGRLPDEPGLLGAGMYNGGLIAVRRSSGPFLDWWEERLRRDALGRPDMMMLADQRWLDFVPVLFDHHVLRDPTYDLAYWNLHERPTAWVDGRLCVVDRPVRCFHYSGLTDARPWLLSAFAEDRPRVALADVPAVARQCREWLARRRSVDADADRALGYHWSHTARGVEVDRRARFLFRTALLAAEADPTGRTPVPPNPFAADGGAAWETWLRTPTAPDGVGPYLDVVRQEAPDLQRRYPAVPGDDAAGLLVWAVGPEADTASIPDALRPLPEEVPVTGAAPTHTVRTPPRPDAAAQRPVEAVDRARAAVATPPAGPPGTVGKVVDRLLGGRDRHHDEVTTALADAVAELAERLAALSDRVDRTNDKVHDGAVRADQAAAADDEQQAEATRLALRADATAADLESLRADLAGAHEQDRITGAIVSDAEARLVEQVAELRLRLDKLTHDIHDIHDDTNTEEQA